MKDTAGNRYILVTRKTRLEELVMRFNTWPQAKFYLEHNQMDTHDYLEEHNTYIHCIHRAENVLRERGTYHRIERDFLPNYLFDPADIVVVIGQDGLVANTLKYVHGQPVIAINPDPARWDGLLLPFEIDDLAAIVQRTENNKCTCRSITLAQAETNKGERMLAVNDLFIGPKTHTSARYGLTYNGRKEKQSSSGIIVSTGLGSTGWLQSILAGAMGITGQSSHPLQEGISWDDKRLYFSVREPFPSRTTGTSLVFGEVSHGNSLVLESYMPDSGIVFSDGIEKDFLNFNSGSLLTVSIAETTGHLVVS
ncbi:NAD(+)/NADH kinase [Desulfogranum japonicum]|uniref:sugar kinase n=1 Tax=Desulfogranum japonicum TaxID=231447 RepID=UPI00049006D6|nr:sugar kinase [Desulfogranum japonicum]